MERLRAGYASKVMDPFFWTVVKRYPLFERLREFRRDEWDDEGAFRRRQGRRLGALLQHAATRVPFYRERVSLSPAMIKEDPFAALAMFPILTRSDLSEHLSDLLCEMGRGTFANSSGGSTGGPVRFYQDRVWHGAALASTILMYEWCGVAHGERHAKLWGARSDIGGGARLLHRLADGLWNRMTLDAFEMGEERMRGHVRALNRFRPVVLEGYADGLYELALFIERSGLAVVAPRAVVSSASTLYPHMREKIAAVFGAPVYDRYGTRELGNVASECERREGLHVFGETTVLEVGGGPGAGAGGSDGGELLATNLWNYTMPLVRYRVGDRGIASDARCGCGRPYPMLKRIVGRSEACLRRRDGGVVLPEFVIHLIGVETNDGAVAKFQVIQDAFDHVVVRAVPAAGRERDLFARREEIAARMCRALGDVCRVEFVTADEIAPTPTGKHLYTVCTIGGRAT